MSEEQRNFWLVQRLRFEPPIEDESKASLLAKLASTFGGPRISEDFVCEYMGAAEFEFGAITEASERMQQGPYVRAEFTYRHPNDDGTVHESKLVFLWREQDGNPIVDWERWVRDGMDSKERPVEMEYRLKGEKPGWWRKDDDPRPRTWETALYWALHENVLWGWAEDGYMDRITG